MTDLIKKQVDEILSIRPLSEAEGTWLTEYTEEEAEKEFPNIAKYSTSTDLISRQDAIELCADAQGRASTKAELKGISKVWQGLLKLPSAKDEWTPVSEGLPDTDVPVLVSDGVYVWEDELQEDYEDGKTVYWWDSQCSFDFNDTAWMPRPKPYRKGVEA